MAMIFEFRFDLDSPDVFDEYLEASAHTRGLLAEMEGFRGVERYQSCSDPDRYVAVGFFDDEEAVARWREHPAHRRVQQLGRERFFTDYRLVMCEVVRDYGPTERAQAPSDSRTVHG